MFALLRVEVLRRFFVCFLYGSIDYIMCTISCSGEWMKWVVDNSMFCEYLLDIPGKISKMIKKKALILLFTSLVSYYWPPGKMLVLDFCSPCKFLYNHVVLKIVVMFLCAVRYCWVDLGLNCQVSQEIKLDNLMPYKQTDRHDCTCTNFMKLSRGMFHSK